MTDKSMCDYVAGKPGRGDFHIVAPSLPGFGFSEAPHDPGFGVPEYAATFNDLMLALGYTQYIAQGELPRHELAIMHTGTDTVYARLPSQACAMMVS